MRIAVLGGGLQGCCAALALADRGQHVTIFDKNDDLITKAGAANEGKIHLGYMYASDASMRTARTMASGAFAFRPFLERYLDADSPALKTSAPAAYVIHRDAQRSPEALADYLFKAHAIVAEKAAQSPGAYFGRDFGSRPRRYSPAELEAKFNPELAVDAYETQEVAIDPRAVAEALRTCIAAHPRIETRLGCTVVGAEETPSGVTVHWQERDGTSDDSRKEGFDHAVNALWDGRLALDEKVGLMAGRNWIHRLKYGVSFRLPEGVAPLQSATFVVGPFGEVVTYGEGLTYLTWYPACLRAITQEVQPPDWETVAGEPLRTQIAEETVRGMVGIVPGLSSLEQHIVSDAVVRGGAIVAWGETDIDDPASELHKRYEIGIRSKGRYHSIDPGKLTMVPYFAERCAERIAG